MSDTHELKASLARVAPHAAEVVDLFYMRLFAIAPEVRDLFPDDLAAQNAKFLAMFEELVGLSDRPGPFARRLEDLGRRHRAYGATPAHYRVVEEALLWAIASRLGEDYTAEVAAAWKDFYRSMAEPMLQAAAVAKPASAESLG
jgi:hemoglobin-like flavoprotein